MLISIVDKHSGEKRKHNCVAVKFVLLCLSGRGGTGGVIWREPMDTGEYNLHVARPSWRVLPKVSF